MIQNFLEKPTSHWLRVESHLWLVKISENSHNLGSSEYYPLPLHLLSPPSYFLRHQSRLLPPPPSPPPESVVYKVFYVEYNPSNKVSPRGYSPGGEYTNLKKMEIWFFTFEVRFNCFYIKFWLAAAEYLFSI